MERNNVFGHNEEGTEIDPEIEEDVSNGILIQTLWKVTSQQMERQLWFSSPRAEREWKTS